MKEVMDTAFEIDLKILQALLPLTTNFANVTGDSLAEVRKKQKSKTKTKTKEA